MPLCVMTNTVLNCLPILWASPPLEADPSTLLQAMCSSLMHLKIQPGQVASDHLLVADLVKLR